MAVEKMKLLSITGKDTDLDDFLIKNLLNMDIQIEDAKRVYKKGWKLQYFNYNYTIKEYIKKCEKIFADFQIEKNENNDVIKDNQPIDEIKKEIDEILNKFEEYNRKIKENEDLIINYKSEFEIVDNLTSLNIKLEQLYNLKYMKFRYGKIPTKNLEEVHSKIDNMDVVYYELKSDEEYTWIFYITTTEYNGKVDSLFNKQDFDRIWIPQEAIGTPSEYVKKLNDNINDCENKINNTKCQIDELKSRCHSELNRLYNSNKAELVAVFGRRRVGKTYLINHFFKNDFVFKHTGLSPEDDTENLQLNRQLMQFYTSLLFYGLSDEKKPQNWYESFFFLPLFK